MIEAFQLIRNVGAFDSVTTGAQLPLAGFSLIYAENGRGKTTLSALLRSLQTGDATLVAERHRLGAQNPPHAVMRLSGGVSPVFQNGAWSATLPELTIFDDQFVASNVCAGLEVDAQHRQNLHELIIGEQGVALYEQVQNHIRRIEQHNRDLQARAAAIPAESRHGLSVDAFCDLENRADIDDALQQAQRALAAGRDADAIRSQPPFRAFGLPKFDLRAIEAVLARSLPEMEAAAAAQVQTHLASIGPGGEAWVSDGMERIAPVSQVHERETCPFCVQNLAGSQIIAHYRTYFSDAYRQLKSAIDDALNAIAVDHGGEVQAEFERSIGEMRQNAQFWGRFTELPAIDLDTAAIARTWKMATEAVVGLLRNKQAAPLDRLEISNDATAAITAYHQVCDQILGLSDTLTAANDDIALIKERAAASDVVALERDCRILLAIKERFKPEIATLCDAYLSEKAAKERTEGLRDAAREALDQYRENVFPAYQAEINRYLALFNAGFRLDRVSSVNIRSGSTCNYSVLINQVAVPVTANLPGAPSFRTTLSAGDRNTLALAFFFASLARDANLANRIVVIDDPMTSLDEHRTLTTIQEMRRLGQSVAQLIILSHSKRFLCDLWTGANDNNRAALRIVRANPGSTLDAWDVSQDCITENDRRHEAVRGFIQNSVGADDRAIAADLRPILEAFVRVAYPQWFPPEAMLGHFHNLCQQREGTPDQILSPQDRIELRALLDYANQFHHDTNPAWRAVLINDQELLAFCSRTLAFCRRP